MRNLFYFLFVLSLGILTACEGPQGPQGPQGEQGEQGEKGATGARGPQGEDGNANVKVADLTISSSDWINTTNTYFYSGYASFTATEIFGGSIADGQTESMKGAVIVYVQLSDLTYAPLPYTITLSNGEIKEKYYFSWSASNTSGMIHIYYSGVRDNGVTSFSPATKYRVVWIPSMMASEQQEIMTLDYATVAGMYGIEE